MKTIPSERLYFSTVGLTDRHSYSEVLSIYQSLGIERVELGYCSNHEFSPVQAVDQYDFKLLCHNYFIPDEPLIINLASEDSNIGSWSVSYIQNAIDFCAIHDIGLYTFHGGFRVDPTVELDFLGEPAPFEKSFDTFLSRLEIVAEYAAERDITLGVENNVVEPQHLDGDRNKRLMFCRSSEFERLFGRLSASNVGVLLDLGHLRVTSETLGFDASEFGRLVDHVVAVHLHENDGVVDRHDPINSSGWALQYLNEHLDSATAPVIVESHFSDQDTLKTIWREISE